MAVQADRVVGFATAIRIAERLELETSLWIRTASAGASGAALILDVCGRPLPKSSASAESRWAANPHALGYYEHVGLLGGRRD